MNPILNLILACAAFALASCACCKPEKTDSCCASGASKGGSCYAEPGKDGGHKH